MTASMRFALSIRKAASLAALTVALAAQGQINSVTGIKWPPITGAGTPASLSVPCGATNYGQPYQNTAVVPNTRYHCAADGWELEAGGGGGSGTVTTSGSPVSPNIAAFSSSTAITPAT